MPDEAPEFSVNVLPEALAIPSRRVELIGDADLTALPELLSTFTWVAPERPVLDAVPFNCAQTFPGKTVGLSLLIGDLVGGADPRQPKFDWRRRNLATSGTGEFSAWQTTIGRELFVTPVDLAGGAPEPSP
jgi:hypothetical protein